MTRQTAVALTLRRSAAWVFLSITLTHGSLAVAASPLAAAIQRQDWKQAESLITPDAIDAAQPDGMTPLHWAVRHGNRAWTKRLLDAGADPDATTHYDVMPLSIACRGGDTEIATMLLVADADPNAALAGKVTCLMIAARTGVVPLVLTLIDHGAKVDATQRDGQTALMWAAAAGHADVIDTLIAAAADPDHTLDSGFTAMMFAAREGQIEAAMRLLDHGVDVNAVMDPKRTSGRNPREGMTALMLAVESAHYELAMRLIDRGADPNDQASEFAPLHALVWTRRPQKGDNPEGDPPPRGSGSLSALGFVRAVVAAGADVNLQLRRGNRGKGRLNTRGATPFLMASQTCDLPYMKLLLELGADPTLTNIDGCTALMAAAGIGNHHVGEHPATVDEVEQAVRMLVDLGLDINAVDKNGETAMHGAAYLCYPETVRLVASLGAKPEIWHHKNSYGWTPLIIAKGYRPGSFKPDPPTIEAITEVLGDFATDLDDEGVSSQPWYDKK